MEEALGAHVGALEMGYQYHERQGDDQPVWEQEHRDNTDKPLLCAGIWTAMNRSGRNVQDMSALKFIN